MATIIITTSENQVRDLKGENDNPKFNLGFWGHKQMNYDTAWYWVAGDGPLHGSSGYIH